MELTVIKKDPFVAKIQRWNIEKIRSTLDDLVAVPGPNAYKNSLKPFLDDKMAVGMNRGPTMALLKSPSKSPRKVVDMKNEEGEFVRELKFSPPGVGSPPAGQTDAFKYPNMVKSRDQDPPREPSKQP